MESVGKMRSTVARRISTIAGFVKYCHDKDFSTATQQRTFADPKSITNHVPSDWIVTSLAGYSSKPV